MTTGGLARVNLNANTVDIRFPMAPGNFPYYAIELAVPPGNPHALVAQVSGGGTGYYIDGVSATNWINPISYFNDYHFGFYDSPTNFYIFYQGYVRWVNINSGGLTWVKDILDPIY